MACRRFGKAQNLPALTPQMCSRRCFHPCVGTLALISPALWQLHPNTRQTGRADPTNNHMNVREAASVVAPLHGYMAVA